MIMGGEDGSSSPVYSLFAPHSILTLLRASWGVARGRGVETLLRKVVKVKAADQDTNWTMR